ncbi:MAG: hypothetical protein GY715_22145, partial [Planctomycetes bacterium]|nr:hypothetical protein [Planctomycetota bacterium]
MTGPRENLRVLPDRDWPAADARSVGGKVAGLVRLAECGCPVPAGFCVTTGAYRSHVERALAGDGDGDDDGHRAVRPAAIRRRILDTPIPESLVDEIAEAFGALSAPAGLGPVAVRSSGTREDMPATAFAGLHDTTLNVRDLPTCLTAIRRCWASTWSDRAVAYGRERGLDPRDAGMAVIVQALVPAQVSGVLFSADPVTGDADRVVIESSWGLGESIVSGRVAPDRFVVSRRDWTIVETHVGDKRSECVPDPTPGGFGTIDRDVEPERRGRRTLSDEDILFLARTAVELERHAACPQDIEWARTPSGFVFLQARPITTARGHSSAPTGADDSQVWSNLNTAEVLPDVVSPMTWSVIGQLEPIWRRRACRLGLDIGDLPLIGLVAGRAYFNVTSMAAIGRSIPFARNVDIDMVLGGAGAASAGRPAELELAFDDLPKIRIRPLRTLVALPGLLVSCVRHHPRGATRQTAALAGWRRAAEARDLAGLSDPDLLELFDTALDELFRDEDLLMGPAVGMSYFLALRRACARWLGDDDGAIANALLAGQGGISSAESGHALWNLATLARRDDEVAAGLRAASTFAEARDELATSDGGRDFLAGWDEFLATHGHHTRGEVELLNPRWRERPDYVLALLRGYLESIDASDPIARYDAQALRCEENTEACRRRLRNPLKRAAFDLLLRKARAG